MPKQSEDPLPNIPRNLSGQLRLFTTLSKCGCPTQVMDGRFVICQYAKAWISQVEKHTAMSFDYNRSANVFERVQQKQGLSQKEASIIEKDVKRTFNDVPCLANEEGKQILTRILTTLSKHSSSVGYTQGMSNIVAALFYHADEVIAFELVIRALNDYHLKEVHMKKLPGLDFHCDIIRLLIKDNLPGLFKTLEKHRVLPILFCQNWVICLFSQTIPMD